MNPDTGHMNRALVWCFSALALLVFDFSNTLLARIPGRNVFDIFIAEVGGKPVHDGILTTSITEVVQRFTQVVLMLPAQVGVYRLYAHSRWAMTGLAYRRLVFPLRGIAGRKCNGWNK